MKRCDDPLISVIVPVYNSERYLSKCIKSVVSQSYHNLELILVDDGSTDRSGKICDDFAQKDGRVTVLHSQNRGVSAARNLGLKVANGEYVCFVDADDWIPKDSLKLLVDGVNKTSADLSVGKIKFVFALRNYCTGFSRVGAIRRENEIEWHNVLANINSGPCAKMYKRSIIHDNFLEFPPNVKWGEDTIFLYRYLSFSKSVWLLDSVVYICDRLNDSSATATMKFPNLSEWAAQIAKLYYEVNFNENSVPSKDSVAVITKRYFSWSCGHYACMEGLTEEEAKKEIEKTISLFMPIIDLAKIQPYNIITSDDKVFCFIFEDNASDKIYNYYKNTKAKGSNGIISRIKNFIRAIAKDIKLKWYFGV